MEDIKILEGKYRIIKTLGQGGMSKVYLAENIRLGTLWAIKEIKKGNPSSCLPVEPEILKKLDHPALPRIFDIIEEGDFLYIIMDYIKGTTLLQELGRTGRFSEKIIVDLAKKICDVLEYLHSFKPNPIIYRDMKPSNIILNDDGSIKLIDFGIAREYKKGSGNDTVYIGTRGYAAPEQYGAGQSNEATDIYSLGVTLHHLLTGRSPIEPPYEIKPVRNYDRSLSKEIEYILEKCTRPDPCERYQSVHDLLDDLNRMKINIINRKNTVLKIASIPCIISYKKLVLTVIDNAEFACEMAYCAAKLTNYKVLLLNLDFVSSKADIFLNLEKEINKQEKDEKTGMCKIIDALERDALTPEFFEDCSLKRKELSNLTILTEIYSIDNYKYYSKRDITKLIEYAYLNFELTVITVNKSVFDIYTRISLSRSDFYIIPIHANYDCIREYTAYLAYLNEKYHLPVEKVKFIAYEYKEGINITPAIMKRYIPKGSFAGCLFYKPDRERNRNADSFYSRKVYMNNPEEYAGILSKFNIIPKQGLKSKIRNWAARGDTND